MKKIWVGIFCAMLVTKMFALGATEETKQDAQKAGEELKGDFENLKNDAAETVKSLSTSAQEAGKKIVEDAKKKVQVNCYGVWEFKGAKDTTVLEISEDGTMSIAQKSLLAQKKWTGTFTGNVAYLNFAVKSAIDQIAISKKETAMDESWKILYVMKAEGKELTVTCASIPADKGGHNFAMPTTFIKK